MEDTADVSLCVPWSGTFDGKMEEELKTIESIQRKNMKKFKELKDSLKACPVFNIVSPVRVDHFKQIKKHYLEEENDGLETLGKYNSEYNSLLEQESQLLVDIEEMEKRSKKVKLEIDETEKKYNTMKKIYQERKSALNIAKKLYETSFGMEIEVEGDNHGDEFTATVKFHQENLPVKLKISRANNKIIDFDASSFLSLEESENLKTKFEQSPDPLTLICAIKDLFTNKVN